MTKIKTIADLKFLNEQKTIIQATINNDTIITIEQDDDIHNLFNSCIAGEFGLISEESIITLPEVTDPLELYRSELKCSPLQAKIALYQNGLFESVEELVTQSDFIVQLAWKEAVIFERNSIFINSLKSFLKWPDGSPITDEQLDSLFEEAGSIKL